MKKILHYTYYSILYIVHDITVHNTVLLLGTYVYILEVKRFKRVKDK